MAANSLLTINMITREAVRLWRNTNAFIRNLNQQYDDYYAKDGAKIGDSLRIRLPNDYIVRTGTTASPQATTEQSVTLVISTQKGVDVEFNSAERALKLDDYSERVLAPQMNNLAGNVAQTIMNGSLAGISNWVANFSSGAIVSPTAETWLNAGAQLSINSAPTGSRKIIMDPITEARTVTSLSGLFNPATELSKQFMSGKMYNALGFDWMMDQTVIKTTSGSATTATVNGASQTGTTLVINALSGTLKAGDVITIAGVYGVNHITKDTTGELKQFVVTADAANAATSLSIFPAIVPQSGGNAVPFQTVVDSPANNAVITPAAPASTTYRRNFTFIQDAVTMVTADLPLPRGVHEAARAQYDGLSVRMITDYNVISDQWVTRLDILFGYLWIRPEWACVVADKI